MAVALSVFAASARAETFRVNITADASDSDPGDGVCETARGNGRCSLRAAVQEVNALAPRLTSRTRVSEILLGAGTYTLTQRGSDEAAALSGDLDINAAMIIRGAAAASTIIDAAGDDRVFDVCPAPLRDRAGLEVSLSRLTVRGGLAENGDGGGILFACPLALQDVIVSDNSASLSGGGLASVDLGLYEPRLTLTDSVIANNRALSNGGGIAAESATALTIKRSVISGNRARGEGGGVFGGPTSGSATISESEITENEAVASGGGLAVACPTITATTISGNRAKDGGGIRNRGECGASITHSTISGNLSAGSGAGLANSGFISLSFVTITRNTSDAALASSGGGIFQTGGSAASTLLENTIVAMNTPINCAGDTISSQGSNIASDGSCALGSNGDQLRVDPLLGPLDDNGGNTRTHALLPGSPAIDAAGATSSVTFDQRGFVRPSDGDGDGRYASDVGAFERGAEPPASPRWRRARPWWWLWWWLWRTRFD